MELAKNDSSRQGPWTEWSALPLRTAPPPAVPENSAGSSAYPGDSREAPRRDALGVGSHMLEFTRSRRQSV